MMTMQAAKAQILVSILAVLTMGITVSGCARTVPPAGVESYPQVPEELTVGITTDVTNWYLDRFPDGDARFVWAQVYETLVRLTPDLQLTPGLALSWEPAEGGRRWRFKLRKGVRFHDGSALDAAAVAFSYQKGSYAARTVLRALERVDVVDDHTVEFILARPMPLPHYLTHVAWPIMSPSCVDESGEFIAPVGTGPFKFQSQAADQEIVLTRNGQHWGGPARLETVAFKVIPDAGARVIALEAGELDMMVKVPESDVARLTNTTDITVHRTLSTFTDFVQFNCEQPPFDDLRLRRAVATAIDTEQLSNAILESVGQAAQGRPFSPIMSYANPDLDLIEYDPHAARELVEQAGWQDRDGDGIVEKGSVPLTARLLVNPGANVGSGSRFPLMAEAIQGQLQDIGVDVRIQVVERGVFLEAEAQGDFEMLLRTGYYVWGAYPRHFFVHFSKNEYSHYSDAAYDELITRADATTEPEAQHQLYYRLQEETLARLPAFYLVHQEKVVATGSRVRGYEISAEAPWLNLAGVYLHAGR